MKKFYTHILSCLCYSLLVASDNGDVDSTLRVFDAIFRLGEWMDRHEYDL